MSLVEIREGIYLCSKLLSKVMPMTTEESRSRDTSFALAFEGSEFEELNEEVFKEHLVSSTEELDGAIKQGDEKGEMSSGDSVSLEERESLGDNSDDTGTEQRRKSETPSVNSGRKQGTPSGSVRRKSETPSSTSSEGSRDKNVKMDERVLRNLVAKGKKDGRVSEQEGQEWCIIQVLSCLSSSHKFYSSFIHKTFVSRCFGFTRSGFICVVHALVRFHQFARCYNYFMLRYQASFHLSVHT